MVAWKMFVCIWWMNEWMNEWMKEWRNEGMKEWRNEGRNERTNERMNEWMNGIEWTGLFNARKWSSFANPTNKTLCQIFTEGESDHQVHRKEHQCHQDMKNWGPTHCPELGTSLVKKIRPFESNISFLRRKAPRKKFGLSFPKSGQWHSRARR